MIYSPPRIFFLRIIEIFGRSEDSNYWKPGILHLQLTQFSPPLENF